MRRAQEVVELALKALIKAVCMEYPRRHDVGDAFAEAAAAKDLDLDPDVLDRICEISAYLARDRAPAFYMEVEFSQEQAEKAQSDADFVLNFAEGLAERLNRAEAQDAEPTDERIDGFDENIQEL